MMPPSRCPCCEASHPPHGDRCTFHADAPDDAADFDEVSVMRAEIARLREALNVVGACLADMKTGLEKHLKLLPVAAKEVGRE